MTRPELLLTLLGEECNETAQRVSKAIRFTLEEIQRGQNLTNSERIVYEFNDIVAVMEILHDEGLVDKVLDPIAIAKKKLQVLEYIEYSRKLGVIE